MPKGIVRYKITVTKTLHVNLLEDFDKKGVSITHSDAITRTVKQFFKNYHDEWDMKETVEAQLLCVNCSPLKYKKCVAREGYDLYELSGVELEEVSESRFTMLCAELEKVESDSK